MQIKGNFDFGMFKYTSAVLSKLENLFEENNYTVRYEKGNFKSGYCLIKDKRVLVINKYFNTESRINCLIDLLGQLEIDPSELSESSLKLLHQLKTAGSQT